MVLTAMPGPAEFKPLAVLFQNRRLISTGLVCSALGRAQEQSEPGLCTPGKSALVAEEENKPSLLLAAKAQNDSSLLSGKFHILGAVVLPGARCHR